MFGARRNRRSTDPYRLVLDESEVGRVSVVGGLIVSARDATVSAQRWRDHKLTMGLNASRELKFNMRSGQTRSSLEQTGFSQRDRVPVALDVLAGMRIHLVASVNLVSNAPPRRAYLEGLDWCVSRFRDFVGSAPGARGHQVMVDQPSGLHRVPVCSALDSTAAESPFALYSARWYEGTLPGRVDPDPGLALCELGFAPELVVGCSAHSDLLQIADHVVGCTAQFAARYLDHSNDAFWKDENFCRIARKFWRNDLHFAIGVTPTDLPQATALEAAIARCAVPTIRAAEPRARACCGRAALQIGAAGVSLSDNC